MTAFEHLWVFIQWLWPASLNASVVIGLILIIRALFKDRFAVRWTYWLWLFVLVRMLVPWTPQSPVSMFNLWPRSESAVTDRLSSVASDGTADAMPVARQNTTPVPGQSDPVPEPLDAGRPVASLSNVQVLALIWLAGALGVAGFGLMSDVRLWLRVRTLRPVTDARILDLFEDCKAEMGVHTIVGLILTDRISSPCVFGVVRPRVLLPVGTLESLTEEQLRFVFLHELAHLKRWDNVMGWFMLLAQILHWFNPLVWYSFFRMRTDRELACDHMVLSAVSGNESTDYGSTIMDLSTDLPRLRSIPSVAGIAESRSLLKRRIEMIADFQPRTKARPVFVVALLLVTALVTLTDAQNVRQRRHTVVDRMPQAMFDKLLLYYSFDKDGGSRVVDISGMDFHGKNIKARHTSEGRCGAAMAFNGENSQIVVKDMKLKTYSFAAWVKTDTDGMNNRVLFQLHDGEQSYSIQGAAFCPMDVYVGYGQSIGMEDQSREKVLPVGQWVHLAVTFDGRSVLMYVNGQALSEGSAQTDRFVQGPVFIGGADVWERDSGGFWKGALDEVAIFNRALSSTQVKQLYGMYAPKAATASAPRSMVEVKYEPYRRSFQDGDNIVIDRIEGTASTLKPGNTYTVTGYYTLSSREKAMLHVYATNGETQSKQGPAVEKGTGRFTRTFKFIEEGYPHLSFYPAGGGSGFGGIYFRSPEGAQLGARPERPEPYNTRPRPRRTRESREPETNVAVTGMKMRPYEGGLFQITASIVNTSERPVGKFRVYFYVNDPEKKRPKNHGAGPIAPGKQWNESTMPFSLKEGVNTLEVNIDSRSEVTESDETDNCSKLLVTVEDGQIVKVVPASNSGTRTGS